MNFTVAPKPIGPSRGPRSGIMRRALQQARATNPPVGLISEKIDPLQAQQLGQLEAQTSGQLQAQQRQRLQQRQKFDQALRAQQLDQMQAQPPKVAQMPTYAPSPTLEALSRMGKTQGRMQPSLSSTPARLRGSLSARSRQFTKPSRKVGY